MAYIKNYFIIAAILLLAASCGKKQPAGLQNQGDANTSVNQEAPPPPPPGFIPPLGQPLTLRIYNNAANGFKLKYLSYFQLLSASEVQKGTSKVANPVACDQRSSVCFAIKNEPYKTTDLASAAVSVTVLSGVSMDQCPVFTQGIAGEIKAGDAKQINGQAFVTATVTDSNDGNTYETRLYRTWYDKKCVQLSASVHAKPAGSGEQFDRPDLWQRLEILVNSFEFLKA